jgi:hypothetical protein
MKGKQSRAARRSGGKSRRDPEITAMTQIEQPLRQTRTFTKTLTTSGTIVTGATGYIGTINAAESSGVTSAVNWTALQSTCLEYRVLAVEIQVFPIVNSQTTSTTPAPNMLFVCAYSSGEAPASVGAVSQGPGAKVFDGYRSFKFAASAKQFGNAHLWTQMAATIPVSGNYPGAFGIYLADQGVVPASTASTVYFRVLIKYLTQFRSLD